MTYRNESEHKIETNSLHQTVLWQAIPVAALAAGVALILTQMALSSLVAGTGATYFLQYNASLILGDNVLVEPTLVTLAVGLVVHFALSLLFTLIISIVIHRWGMLIGIVGGGLLGLAFYVINFYAMTYFLPNFFAISGSVLAVSHIVFGAVAGGTYEALDDYDQPIFPEEITQ